jgi:hypothetical protein
MAAALQDKNKIFALHIYDGLRPFAATQSRRPKPQDSGLVQQVQSLASHFCQQDAITKMSAITR